MDAVCQGGGGITIRTAHKTYDPFKKLDIQPPSLQLFPLHDSSSHKWMSRCSVVQYERVVNWCPFCRSDLLVRKAGFAFGWSAEIKQIIRNMRLYRWTSVAAIVCNSGSVWTCTLWFLLTRVSPSVSDYELQPKVCCNDSEAEGSR